MSGPGWIETERYNVLATGADGDTDVVRQRLQAMLADRFHLAVHKAPKEQNVYGFRVAKTGSKLKVTADPEGRRGMHTDHEMTQGFAATTAMLADILSRAIGRPVRDMTCLTDRYDFVLQWSEATGPSIFTAVQEQPGLHLDPGKGEVETIVIDRVERATPN